MTDKRERKKFGRRIESEFKEMSMFVSNLKKKKTLTLMFLDE